MERIGRSVQIGLRRTGASNSFLHHQVGELFAPGSVVAAGHGVHEAAEGALEGICFGGRRCGSSGLGSVHVVQLVIVLFIISVVVIVVVVITIDVIDAEFFVPATLLSGQVVLLVPFHRTCVGMSTGSDDVRLFIPLLPSHPPSLLIIDVVATMPIVGRTAVQEHVPDSPYRTESVGSSRLDHHQHAIRGQLLPQDRRQGHGGRDVRELRRRVGAEGQIEGSRAAAAAAAGARRIGASRRGGSSSIGQRLAESDASAARRCVVTPSSLLLPVLVYLLPSPAVHLDIFVPVIAHYIIIIILLLFLPVHHPPQHLDASVPHAAAGIDAVDPLHSAIIVAVGTTATEHI